MAKAPIQSLAVLQARGKEAVDADIRAGGEAAVDDEALGALRQVRCAIGKVQMRVGGEKACHHFLVFFRFEGAGGINEDASWVEKFGAVVEDLQLFLLIATKVLKAAVPSYVGMTAGDAGPGTWGVDEDAIERMRAL